MVSRVDPSLACVMKKVMMDIYEAELKGELQPTNPPPREEVPKSESSGSCFIGDSLISTPSGLVPISDICAGQLVHNKDGHSVKVVASVKTYAGDMVELYGFAETTLGKEPFFTAAHPFMAPLRNMVVVDKLALCRSNPQLKYIGKVEQMP